jgi:hypothetical protein
MTRSQIDRYLFLQSWTIENNKITAKGIPLACHSFNIPFSPNASQNVRSI